MNPFILGIIIGVILASIGSGLFFYLLYKPEPVSEAKPSEDESGTVDKELSGADGIEIPEEDQQYLAPIISATLQEYVPLKMMYPSNAMLIEHLAVDLGKAAESFEKRRVASDDHQQGNTDWLKVAAWAMRLYKEGTPHNSTSTLERFVVNANLSQRELRDYATRTMNQAGAKMQDALEGKDSEDDRPGVRRMQSKEGGNPLNPYTPSEVDDLKNADDKRRGNEE